MRKALAVGRKEFRQILRDRRTLMILLFVPVFFLLLYGYALNFDIRHVRAGGRGPRRHACESRALVSAFVNSGYFDLVATVHSADDARRLMDQDEVRAVARHPRGAWPGRAPGTAADGPGHHQRRQRQHRDDRAGLRASPSCASVSANLILERGGLPAAAPPVAAEPRIWFNPELRSTLFLVPGLIAFIAMITAVISTALSIVREKERGTREQVRMAPIAHALLRRRQDDSVPRPSRSRRRWASSCSPWCSSACRCAGRGRCCSLAILLFLVGALGTGLLISTLADSQLVAFQVVLHPRRSCRRFMLSGFIFPIASMPAVIQRGDLHRAGALLPGRAAGHRAEGRRPRRSCGGRWWRW